MNTAGCQLPQGSQAREAPTWTSGAGRQGTAPAGAAMPLSALDLEERGKPHESGDLLRKTATAGPVLKSRCIA